MQAHMERLQLMEQEKLVQEKNIRIIAKPNAPKTRIAAVDEARNALRVDVKAPPDKDKANKEIIKFFSKLLKKKIKIVRGLRSKEKVLKVED